MMTAHEVECLNEILAGIPTSNSFKVSNIIGTQFFTLWNTLDQNFRLSEEITTFLNSKGFAEYIGDDFWDEVFESRSLQITERGMELIQAGTYQNYMKDIVQEPNQLKRLDWVLDYMAKHAVQGRGIENSWVEIKKLHPTIHLEYLESYRQQMFDKLVADKHIETVPNIGFRITWQGSLFNDKGGYVGLSDRENADKIRLDKVERSAATNRKLTLWLTVAIAAGNICPSLFYIQETKRLNWLYSFNVIVSLETFLFGLTGGLMLYLIREEILARKK